MEQQRKNDNAANRNSYVGQNYNEGEKIVKRKTLDELTEEQRKLHEEGTVHFHDQDAAGKTYNCSTFDLRKIFPYEEVRNLSSDAKKIRRTFGWMTELICELGNEQSGGMAVANMDKDLAEIFRVLGIDLNKNREIIKAEFYGLIKFFNNIHTRMGQTSYYVTFNIGLGIKPDEVLITSIFLEEFEKCGELVYKPNIVFKVKKGINRFEGDPNFPLLKKALLVTGKKMIPTYLLCDCESDRDYDPETLSVMGCRTRVIDDRFGKTGAIGRGNIANISINLPRLAVEVLKETENNPEISFPEKMELMYSKVEKVSDICTQVLVDRYHKTVSNSLENFPTNCHYNLLCENMKEVGVEKTLRHGTLSIGFIGLSEAMEILSGKKFWENPEVYEHSLKLVQKMRDYTNRVSEEQNLNFSLLATSGELISGRFVELDQKKYGSFPVMEKGYYTNSFHVDVDSGLPAKTKLKLEGPFHKHANGGSISYVELKEAPLGNYEGLDELLETAVESGVRYLGFNFPKDVCKECGASGTFDECPLCKSKSITRIRRVSGYLEIQDFFTSGKMHEAENRKANA